jgi:NDP-sugar pyrophosphorylase family protein
MVLAAGKATRLRPLTDSIAKPALSFVGTAILSRVLDGLANAGVDEAIVNLHHAPESVRELIRQRGSRLPRVMFSHEKEELLGTGGALIPVRGRLADGDFLIVNGDCVHAIDYGSMIEQHRTSGASATLAVRPRAEAGFRAMIVKDGVITSFREESRGNGDERHFLSVQIVSPAILAHLPSTPASFDSFAAWYPAARAAGHVFRVHETLAEWHALDSRELYLEAQSSFLRARGLAHFVDDAASVEDASIEGAAIHRGAIVERGARIVGSAVLEDAVIGQAAVVRDSIIGPGARVPAGAEVSGLLVASAAASA